MKLSAAPRLAPETLPDWPKGESKDLLLKHLNAAIEELQQALSQNLTLGDNMNAAVTAPIRMTHATEVKIRIPDGVKGRPIGVKALRTIGVNGGTQYALLGDPKWRLIDAPDPKQPPLLGITVNFAPTTIGEVVTSVVDDGSANSLATTVTENLTSIPLTAGKWELTGYVAFGGDPTVNTAFVAGITANSSPGFGGTTNPVDVVATPTPPDGNSEMGLSIGPYSETVSSATTRYLAVKATFGAGACEAWGWIRAKRLDVDPAAKNDVAFVVYGG